MEWHVLVLQSNATKDQDFIADGAVLVFEQSETRRSKNSSSYLDLSLYIHLNKMWSSKYLFCLIA